MEEIVKFGARPPTLLLLKKGSLVNMERGLTAPISSFMACLLLLPSTWKKRTNEKFIQNLHNLFISLGQSV